MNSYPKFLLLSLIVTLLNGFLPLVFLVPRFDHTDTPLSIGIIKYVGGDSEDKLSLPIILKPSLFYLELFLFYLRKEDYIKAWELVAT